MSSLEQAFIRAYQVGNARPAATANVATAKAASHDSAKPARVEAIGERKSPAALSGRVPQATASQTTMRRQHFVDNAHARSATPSSTPHFAVGSAEDEYARLAESLVAANRAAARVVDLSVSAPIAEMVAETIADAADEGKSDGAVEPLRAAFETKRFSWPRNVEVLVASAGNEFSELAQELSERSASGRKTLVVTGVERGEGRTSLVLALARLAAARGLRTVVVDLDLVAPSVAEQLGLRPELGWDDAMVERMTAADAMIESLDDRISVLPLLHGPANPRSLSGGSFLRNSIAELRERFDLVLLDVGPLADEAQTIDLAAVLCGAKLDDALIVRDRRRTSPKQVQTVCRHLAVLGIDHWDVAESFCEIQGY